MNRKDDYMRLSDALEDTPIKLDFTYERALARYKEHKRRRSRKVFLAPLAALLSVFAMFVILVNVSPTFAYAAGRIPFIAELAKFVAASPSLSAAVENEYVQPVGLEKTQDGVKARIEYLIVDQKQLNIFYTLESEAYSLLTSYADILSADGSELWGFSILAGHPPVEGGLQKITVNFAEDDMPSSLILKLRVQDISGIYEASEAPPDYSLEDSFFKDKAPEPEIITEILFDLNFDPIYTDTGETIDINKKFILDGQELTFQNAEIYPTHMRFTFGDFQENTAWLNSLSFYVENEKGERFEGISNGISASGSIDSPMMATHMLESAFFSNSEHLTLVITSVKWLDKDMEKLHVDLAAQTADILPEGVSLVSAKKHADGWLLEFTAKVLKEGQHTQVWGWDFYDAQGNKYSLDGMSSTSAGSSYSTSGDKVPDDVSGIMFSLRNYPYDEVWLCPIETRSVELDVPIRLEIK